jgi:hypothetical protein
LATNIRNSSGYVGGAAQIPHANTIDNKSRPNLTTNIRNSSGYAKGAAQISQANAINDKSLPNSSTKLMTSLIPIHPQTSQILHVTPEVLPKFHNKMQSMTSLIPIHPQTSAILKSMLGALP